MKEVLDGTWCLQYRVNAVFIAWRFHRVGDVTQIKLFSLLQSSASIRQQKLTLYQLLISVVRS